MAGVPDVLESLGWWAVALFLLFVVFTRAQATYWLGRWARRGADAAAASERPRAAALANKLSGPRAEGARRFLEKWGPIGLPLSFLTIGFQTMVNITAGYVRMRWDIYTIAMIPGCMAWAAIYSTLGFTLFEAFATSPWLGGGVILAIIALVWGATRLRQTADSGSRTPQ